MDEKLDIAIIGFGPVGGIFGAFMSRGGNNVIPVDILKGHLDKIKQDGLSMSGIEEFNVGFKDLCYDIKDLDGKDFDYLVISVKAVILPFIMDSIEKVIGPDTFMISLQNGLDTEKDIADRFGRDRVARIVVNYAGNLIGDGAVRMNFFNAPNYIGAMEKAGEEKARALADAMTAAKLETVYDENVRKHVWEKVILNAGLSPVCAITRKTMKEMMDFPDTEEVVTEVLKEGIMVAKAQGYDYGPDFLDHCLQYLKKAGYHQTSMHVDVENKRRTEIGYLNEKIVLHGKENGIKTPYNACITALIKGLEMKDSVKG